MIQIWTVMMMMNNLSVQVAASFKRVLYNSCFIVYLLKKTLKIRYSRNIVSTILFVSLMGNHFATAIGTLT